MNEELSPEARIEPLCWELDEEHNALDYLEMSVRSLMEVEQTPWAWKWVCIALHGTLYGFAVCAVQGTDYHRVTYEAKDGYRKLKSFDDILRMCQDDTWMKQYTISRTLVLSEEQRRSIDFLKNALRNTVEHFVPASWLIEIHGLPQMVSAYYDIIEFLALESGNLVLEDPERARIKVLCDSGRQLALSTKIHWEVSQELI